VAKRWLLHYGSVAHLQKQGTAWIEDRYFRCDDWGLDLFSPAVGLKTQKCFLHSEKCGSRKNKYLNRTTRLMQRELLDWWLNHFMWLHEFSDATWTWERTGIETILLWSLLVCRRVTSKVYISIYIYILRVINEHRWQATYMEGHWWPLLWKIEWKVVCVPSMIEKTFVSASDSIWCASEIVMSKQDVDHVYWKTLTMCIKKWPFRETDDRLSKKLV
jgi:hypothetical protein